MSTTPSSWKPLAGPWRARDTISKCSFRSFHSRERGWGGAVSSAPTPPGANVKRLYLWLIYLLTHPAAPRVAGIPLLGPLGDFFLLVAVAPLDDALELLEVALRLHQIIIQIGRAHV